MIRQDAPLLSELTTLRLGGRVRSLYRLTDEKDLDVLGRDMARKGASLPLIIGGGSNILAREGDYDLDLVHVDWKTGPEIIAREGNKVLVRVGASARMPGLVRWCRDQGLSGMEDLAGLPGTLGGAVAGNAGTRERDMASLLHQVTFWTPDAGLVRVPAQELAMGYREMCWAASPGWHLVTHAVLMLEAGDAEVIRQSTRDSLDKRRASQPLEAWTAGCVFKNPPHYPAGFLRDRDGW